MMLDCCAQQRTYEKFYGLLAEVRDWLKVGWKRFSATVNELAESGLEAL